MKAFVKYLLPVVLGLVTSSLAAEMLFDIAEISPYLGVDYQHRWMDSKFAIDNSKVIPRSYTGASAYLGIRYCYFGLEAGYDYSGAKKTTIMPGGAVLARVEIRGGHIDL